MTKDRIQHDVDQLSILSRLIPLIEDDFAMATQNANQMGAWEQVTMDLILAHECQLQEERACQRDPTLHGLDEVSSHADSPRAAAALTAWIECDGDASPETMPSTSTAIMNTTCATATAEDGPIPVSKLKRKSATKRGHKETKVTSGQ